MHIISVRFLIFSFVSLALVLASAVPSVVWADAPAQVVYITQVQISNGPGKTRHDFIELFNPNAAPFNLKGYRLVKRTALTPVIDAPIKSWDTDTFIAPYSFYLWANTDLAPTLQLPADATTTAIVGDDHGVALRTITPSDGPVIDSFSWGNAHDPNPYPNVIPTNPAAGEAIFRTDLFAVNSGYEIRPSDPRNSMTPAVESPVIPPVGQVEPPQDPPVQSDDDIDATENPAVDEPDQVEQVALATTGKIIISELLPNPAGEDSGHEAIELYNDDSKPISLEGWQLTDATMPDSRATAIGSVILNPGQILLITLPESDFTLNNSGDKVSLFDRDLRIIDSVLYSSAPEGKSYQRINGSFQWLTPTLDRLNTVPIISNNYQLLGLQVTEVLPNPEGTDGGQEWVEIYNPGPETFDLSAWFLDHIPTSGDELTSGAYQFPTGTFLEAGSYKQLFIPSGKFQFKNTAQDVIRLLTPDKTVKFTQYFMDVPEGLSYAKNEQGVWENLLPSPGRQNSTADRPVVEMETVSAAKTTEAEDDLVEDLAGLLFKDSELGEDGVVDEGSITNDDIEIEIPAVPQVKAAKTTAVKKASEQSIDLEAVSAVDGVEAGDREASIIHLEEQIALLAEKIEKLADLSLSRAQAADIEQDSAQNPPVDQKSQSKFSYILVTGLMLLSVLMGYVVGKNKTSDPMSMSDARVSD